MSSRPDEFENVPGLLEFTAAAPPALAARCRREHPGTIAILGGSQVYSAFADAGLVDEWQITVEPVLFGAGLPLLVGPLVQGLRLVEIRKLNTSTVLLRYVR
jgi:dihydrofolate reductase